MKIRLEGNQEEIKKFIEGEDGLHHIGVAGGFKSISKFYPNQNTCERILNRKTENGRVYIELNQ